MENGLFAYILRYSKRQQIVLLIMIVFSFPFYYVSLDLPKTIINDAISGAGFPLDINFDIIGLTIDIGSMEQIPYLVLLCIAFLLLVLINSGFKYFINIYRGTLGERMLRRMRLQLIDRIMRFPLTRFRNTSQGELVSMVNQETEPLGGFIGESYSLPLYQGGILLTILAFMFAQDWKLGLAAIALYPVQAWLIPKLQRQVNLLNQQRTIRMRNLAENLGEVVAGINEIHVNDNSNFFKDHFSKLLGGIFNIRVQIYRKKFFIKFLNNSIAQLTPFLFYLIGGILVIRGDLSIGALVAALAAYKDLSPPWKELLAWYQGQADARLKYKILTEQFSISDVGPQTGATVSPQWLEETQRLPIVANNISLKRNDGVREVSNISLTIDAGSWINLVGSGSSGKNGLAQMLARLVKPTRGKLMLADQDAAALPQEITGRAISYVGHDSYLFSASLRDNILLSIKFKAQDTQLKELILDDAIAFKDWRKEAQLSGNSDTDLNADWVDHQSAGATDSHHLTERIGSILNIVEAEDDLVRYALARTINPATNPELADRLLLARKLFKEKLIENGFESIVEFLDPEQYNENATLAENILFGASDHDEFSANGLAGHPVLRNLLDEYGLTLKLDDAAISTATTMVELFSDLPPGHEFFDRYGFINADNLLELKRILSQLGKIPSIDSLAVNDRKLIRSLPFKVISGRHRIGILQEEQKARVLQLRESFAKKLDDDARQKIDFFSLDSYNASTTIAENITFGRIVYGRLGAETKVHSLLLEVLNDLDLMNQVLEIGLAAPVGLAGSLLAVSQRQKLVLARALIKQPRILVINEGLSALDAKETRKILAQLKEDYPQLTLVWVDSQARFKRLFDQTAYLQAGKLLRIEERAETLDQELTDEEPSDNDENVEETSVRSASSVADDEKLELLQRIPLFKFLDKPQLMLLAKNCDAVNLAKGERFFDQGDAGDALYIIIDGTASILISDGENDNKVQECGADEVIGELALLADGPRTASVEAATDVAALRLSRDVFIDILRQNGELGYQILQVVVERFADTNKKLAKLIHS